MKDHLDTQTPWQRLKAGSGLVATDLLRPELRSLSRYHLDRGTVRFKLDQNEPPWELPLEVRERVAARWLAERWSSYPDFHADELRARLGAFHGVDPEGVLVGNGSNELLAIALVAFAGIGRTVLGIEPSFGLYQAFVAKAGASVEALPLRANLSLPIDELQAAIRRDPSRPVLLCTPNNPTGGAASVEQVEALLQELEAPLFLDNAYGEFCRFDYRPLLARYPHLVIFRTFSKAWALAASRIGYLLAAPAVVEALIRVKLPYNLDRWSAIAAEEALGVSGWVQQQVDDLVTARSRWAQVLRELGGLEVFESEANFLLVRVADDAEAEASRARAAELFATLASWGLLVRDVGGYAGLAGCLRISIGSAEALAVLEQCLTSRSLSASQTLPVGATRT